MNVLKSKNAPEAIGPYSQGKEAGGFCFFSGQIAIDVASGEMVQSSFKEEVTQVMSNIAHLLKDNDLDFEDLLKVNISLTDMSKFSLFNDIYLTYVKQPYPARACVAVKELPKGANVEIEVIAYRK